MATTSRRTKGKFVKFRAADAKQVKVAVTRAVKQSAAFVMLCADDSKKAPSGSPDSVHHPKHYNAGRFEVIEVIEDWRLGFCLGNTVKYIARAPHKGSEIEDLRKALWYLNRRIEQLQKESGQPVQG